MTTVLAAERTLPHSLDAEKSTLGAIFAHPANFSIAASVVGDRDFFRDAHKRIFRAIARLFDRGAPVDTLTVKEELARVGELDEVGGPAYVASLTDGVPRSTNVQYYATLVREHSRRRDIIFAANRILTDAYEAELDAAAVVERGSSDLHGSLGSASGGLVGIDDAILEYATAIDSGTLGEPIATGYVDLDAVTRGFKPGDLVIVAARPSVGKTSFALGAAENIAAQRRRSIFFPLETGQRNVAAKALGWRAQVATSRLERKEATDEEWRRVGDAVGAGTARPLHIEATARTLAEIGAWCRRAAEFDGGLACAFVDYLQLLMPERRRESDAGDVAEISHGLKRLAKELNIVVVALSQLSRAPEGRKDKRPQLADLRGSGALEQDCDVAILLFREEMHSPKPENEGIAEVIVAKHRNGPTGVVRMYFNSALAQFRDLAKEF